MNNPDRENPHTVEDIVSQLDSRRQELLVAREIRDIAKALADVNSLLVQLTQSDPRFESQVREHLLGQVGKVKDYSDNPFYSSEQVEIRSEHE